MTRAELEALIDAGQRQACVSVLEGLSEAERAKLGAAAITRLKAIVKGVHPGFFTWLNQCDDFRLSDVMTEDPWSDTRAKSDVPHQPRADQGPPSILRIFRLRDRLGDYQALSGFPCRHTPR